MDLTIVMLVLSGIQTGVSVVMLIMDVVQMTNGKKESRLQASTSAALKTRRLPGYAGLRCA